MEQMFSSKKKKKIDGANVSTVHIGQREDMRDCNNHKCVSLFLSF